MNRKYLLSFVLLLGLTVAPITAVYSGTVLEKTSKTVVKPDGSDMKGTDLKDGMKDKNSDLKNDKVLPPDSTQLPDKVIK